MLVVQNPFEVGAERARPHFDDAGGCVNRLDAVERGHIEHHAAEYRRGCTTDAAAAARCCHRHAADIARLEYGNDIGS